MGFLVRFAHLKRLMAERLFTEEDNRVEGLEGAERMAERKDKFRRYHMVDTKLSKQSKSGQLEADAEAEFVPTRACLQLRRMVAQAI